MRASGILLPISSLPGKYGIGCFSKEAYKFVDFLEKAGQKYWQILPVGPTSYGDSPYQSFSTFAGNPYFISLESLVEQGLLKKKECDEADFGKLADSVDYHKLYLERFQLLRKAYERSNITQKEEFHDFRRENAFWLNDYAVFMAVKTFFGGKSFEEWPEDIRRRWEYALNYYRRELYYDIEFYEYIQYEFYRQWFRLKKYANEKAKKDADANGVLYSSGMIAGEGLIGIFLAILAVIPVGKSNVGEILGGFLPEAIPALADANVGNIIGLIAFGLLTFSLWKFCYRKSKKS